MFDRTLLLIALLACPVIATAGELAGTASYRERIALPSEAKFRAILFDISSNDQVEIGWFETSGDQGPPYRFVIDYADDAVTDDGLFALKTEVIWPDRAYVAAGMVLNGFPATVPVVDLVMVRPDVAPTAGQDAAAIALLAVHAFALPALFEGVVSNNDRPETWQLALAGDQSFQMLRRFDDGSERSSIGRRQADPSTGRLVLHDGAGMPLLVAPAGPADIAIIDANTGLAFGGTLSRTAGATKLDLSNMILGGMMTYMADAAIFDDCSSGLRFPIAQEGDYLTLERAYLADRAAPGSQLYVIVKAGLLQRPAMEGPDRQMVVADRFIRTQPDTGCTR